LRRQIIKIWQRPIYKSQKKMTYKYNNLFVILINMDLTQDNFE